MGILSVYDLLLSPIYLLIILLLAFYYQKSKQYKNKEYNYFTIGLIVKIIGALALGLVYNFYYEGGDTINYFETAKSYGNFLGNNNEELIKTILGSTDVNYLRSSEAGYHLYIPRDYHAFFVVRLEIPIVLIGMLSYFPSTIITAALCYTGTWKLFQVFYSVFPHLKKQLAIAILFIPSVTFWGSGIMKDSFTLAAVGWFTYAFYNFFILKKYSFIYFIHLFVASYIIIAIKPYIFFAILPGSIVWLSNDKLSEVKNKVLKFIFGPFVLGIGVVIGFLGLNAMGDYLGMYKIDTVLDRAVVVQKDMKADYYNGNSFDIGDFDASATGALSKAPLAIFSGLFRPSILDVRNPMMLLSAFENTFFLFLTLFLLLKLRIRGFIAAIGSNPIVLFSILFSLFFTFSVGLSISNFGSLVRLRIPAIPFFMASLYILKDVYNKKSISVFKKPVVKNNK